MDIGSAIAIFLVLSIVLMALFCFVTKYFHHKFKRSLEEANQVYSMVEELCNESQEDVDGEYDHYIKKQHEKEMKSGKKVKEDIDMMIEMSDFKKPLQANGDDIYGPSALRRRLNGDTIPMNNKQESSRSISSLKSFRPDKMITNRTDRTNKGQQNSKNNEVTKHSFINKLVCYDSQGITTIDVIVSAICKLGQGMIKETKKFKLSILSLNDQNFDDQLEIIGFDKHDYGCYKYQTKVEVQNMKLNEDYMIKSLKTSESKEQIDVEEYLRLRKDIEGGI